MCGAYGGVPLQSILFSWIHKPDEHSAGSTLIVNLLKKKIECELSDIFTPISKRHIFWCLYIGITLPLSLVYHFIIDLNWMWIYVVDQIDHFLLLDFHLSRCRFYTKGSDFSFVPLKWNHFNDTLFGDNDQQLMIFMIIYYTRNHFDVSSLIFFAFFIAIVRVELFNLNWFIKCNQMWWICRTKYSISEQMISN